MRAIPCPEIFINKDRVMELYKQACTKFPQRDYVFNLNEHSRPLFGIVQFATDVLVINKQTRGKERLVSLPAFIADGSHILNIEEFFEYELKFARPK